MLCWVTLSCLTLCDPMDCSPPGSSGHGILQARILEWVAMSSFRGASQPRNGTQVSRIARRFLTIWATYCLWRLFLYILLNLWCGWRAACQWEGLTCISVQPLEFVIQWSNASPSHSWADNPVKHSTHS